MKRLIRTIFFTMLIISLGFTAYAREIHPSINTPMYYITVNKQVIDTNHLPYVAYKQGETMLVPLRIIAESLGYEVDWDAETGEIRIEDHIQRALLHASSNSVNFEGKLKIIDLSKIIEFDVDIVIHEGNTYVPVDFYTYFFNDIVISGEKIDISVQMSELQ